MRICFELLELLKAHKKAIRRATVNTFGYIAKAIGYVFIFNYIVNTFHLYRLIYSQRITRNVLFTSVIG